jgi:hypothetical protein
MGIETAKRKREMMTESRLHRRYELQGVYNAPMWQVGIYPTEPNMSVPAPELQIVSLGDKEAAFAEAERRVDRLIVA